MPHSITWDDVNLPKVRIEYQYNAGQSRTHDNPYIPEHAEVTVYAIDLSGAKLADLTEWFEGCEIMREWEEAALRDWRRRNVFGAAAS